MNPDRFKRWSTDSSTQSWGSWELGDHFIAACNGKPLRSTKAFVRTVRDIEHHVVVSCGIFTDEFDAKRLLEWTKQALKTLEEVTESYMVEVTADPHSRSSN